MTLMIRMPHGGDLFVDVERPRQVHRTRGEEETIGAQLMVRFYPEQRHGLSRNVTIPLGTRPSVDGLALYLPDIVRSYYGQWMREDALRRVRDEIFGQPRP